MRLGVAGSWPEGKSSIDDSPRRKIRAGRNVGINWYGTVWESKLVKATYYIRPEQAIALQVGYDL